MDFLCRHERFLSFNLVPPAKNGHWELEVSPHTPSLAPVHGVGVHVEVIPGLEDEKNGQRVPTLTTLFWISW